MGINLSGFVANKCLKVCNVTDERIAAEKVLSNGIIAVPAVSENSAILIAELNGIVLIPDLHW
jgi:hypothetical protein